MNGDNSRTAGVIFTMAKNIIALSFSTCSCISNNIDGNVENLNAETLKENRLHKAVSLEMNRFLSLTAVAETFKIVNNLKHFIRIDSQNHQSKRHQDELGTLIKGFAEIKERFGVIGNVHDHAKSASAKDKKTHDDFSIK